MKRMKEIIFAAISAIMLVGCVNSADNTSSSLKSQDTEPTLIPSTPTATPSIAPTPTDTVSQEVAPSPEITEAPTTTPISTDTAMSENETTSSSMVDISNTYMSKIRITEDCPASVYEEREGTSYGTVVHKTYDSKTTGLTRGVNIVLPPNYDVSKKYPVVYLLHGIFGDEHVLINDKNNRIVEILGNLIADGNAKEMIIVLPNIFATTDKDLKVGFNAESIAAYDNFINDLTNDLMPFIEENYSILTGRENQAIAGFSMGGREALYIGFQRPDLFGYVLGIAPAPGLTPSKDWAMSHPGQMQEDELKIMNDEDTPYLLMICCGSKDSVVGTFPKSYHDILDKNGVNHIWYEVSGADHDSKAIRSGLYNFLISIFKNEE